MVARYTLPMKITVSKRAPKKKSLAGVEFSDEEGAYLRVRGERKSIVVGIGKRDEMTRRRLMLVPRRIVQFARSHKIKHITLNLKDFSFTHLSLSDMELAEMIALQSALANFEFVKYKTPPKEGWGFLEELVIVGDTRLRRSVSRGQTIAEEINRARLLANMPGGEMTPTILAAEAKKAAGGLAIETKILDKAAIQEIGMGGIIGVSQGSDEEPRFIIMEYRGGATDEKPIVLVGKGITFDTGGLNIKTENYMYEMHMDMSGGAAVIHAVVLAARLQLTKNIIGLIPAAENMPSGSSYRPGDMLKTLSGKTIEVLNTDAEGRIVLADALTYAERYTPRLVVDVATLTGAAMSALGQRASAIFTKDKDLEKRICELGEESGDYVWPLPLWDEYEEDIKGTFGDVANASKVRYGGAITAAMFLYQFAKKYPWVHMDIAPRMTSIEGDYLAKGAVGAPISLLIKLLERF